MTTIAIKKSFGRMDDAEQAKLLQELAAEHARRLSDQDRRDHAIFVERRAQEKLAKPWADVKARLARRRRRSA